MCPLCSITIEGCSETSRIASQMFHKYKLSNIQLKVGLFEDILPDLVQECIFDLIFIDGNHTKSATLKYFNLCLDAIHNNSVVILDDIHWSVEMEEAWEEIKKHAKVTVTIDTFQWGIVFFRKEQMKEHFTIRV